MTTTVYWPAPTGKVQTIILEDGWTTEGSLRIESWSGMNAAIMDKGDYAAIFSIDETVGPTTSIHITGDNEYRSAEEMHLNGITGVRFQKSRAPEEL